MNKLKVDALCCGAGPVHIDQLKSKLGSDTHSYEFELTSNERDFFVKLQKSQYSLALIGDLEPDQDRTLLIKNISHQYPHLPVVVLSNDVNEDRIVEAVRAGATDTISLSNLTRLRPVFLKALSQANSAENTAYVSNIAANLPGLLYQLVRDKNGKISLPYANPIIRDFTSLNTHDLSKNAIPIYAGILEEDRARVLGSIEQSAKNLTLWEEDFRVKAAKGKTRWIRGISSPKRKRDGSTVWNGLMIDVTKERQTSAHLKDSVDEKNRYLNASETRRQTILDTVIDGIITIDETGIIETVNKAALSCFGYQEEELKGRNISILMPSPYAEKHDHYLSKYLKTQQKNILDRGREVEGVRKDGSVFPLQLAVSEMFIDEKRMFTGIVRDISQRIKAEDSLRVNEERMRLSQQFSNIATWEWNLENDDFFWSRGPLSGEGTPINGGAILKFETVLNIVHPDDRDGVMESIHQCLEEGMEYAVEHRSINSDGVISWVQERGDVVRDDEGKPLRMMGISQDITTRKENEQKLKENEQALREAQRFAKTGHWSYNYSSQTLHWSDEIFHLFSLDPNQINLTVETFLELVHPEDKDTFATMLDDKLHSQFPQQKIDSRIILPGGKIRWVHLESKTQFDENNLPLQMNGIVQDVTEHKLAEIEILKSKEEAEEAKKEAEKANQAKSEFLSRMSHELRTPMNAILGFTQLLELEKYLTEPQREAVSEIHHAADHLLDLIKDVLNLSRIESGKILLSMESVNIQEMLNECEKLISPLSNKYQINISWEYPKDKLDYMYVDKIRIKEVLLNLLSNAIKYNHVGGDVKVSTEFKTRNIMRIKVRDTGVGITPDQQKNLFKSFIRLGAESTNIEGTGIGLVITKQLIELMGGSIGFESNRNGSTFWIDTPLSRKQRLPEADTANRVEDTIEEIQTEDQPDSLDILYIENNTENLKLIQQILARRPFANLLSTHDNQIGLELAIRKQPDLILLDINLPDRSGYELLNKLNHMKETNGIPVIGLSAHALPESIEKTLSKGFTAYLTKPINVRQFLNIIDHLTKDQQQIYQI